MVAPLLIVSSSGWACTRSMRREGVTRSILQRPRSGTTTPPHAPPSRVDHGVGAGDTAGRAAGTSDNPMITCGTPVVRCGDGSVHVDGDDRPGLGEVAGRRVPLVAVDQGGGLLGADVLGLPAAGAGPAPRGRVGRARHVALQDDPVLLATQVRLVQR